MQKEIDGQEYDLCSDCWKPLEQRLRGKGRPKKEIVLLPPPEELKPRKDDDERPVPGGPPKIWGGRPN